MDSITTKIIPILKKYKIKKAALFGSYVRGEQTKNSDVDILVEPPKKMGLDFFMLQHELEKALQKKVDLITYSGINPLLKEHILPYQKMFYET